MLTSARRRFARSVGLACGVAGPLLFVIVFLVFGSLEPGYDPMREHVSELALTRDGWVQTLNFILGGSLLVIFAATLLTAGPDRSVGMAISAGLVGFGLVLAGVFPVGIEHAGAAVLVLLGLLASAIVLGMALARARRSAWAAVAFLSVLVQLVFFQISGETRWAGMDVGNVAGLTQRVWLITGFSAILAYAINLLRRPSAR